MPTQELPNLMPFQVSPFNGDRYIEKEFLKLKERFGITTAIETGTCLAGTTIFLGQNFDRTFTIEINKPWLKIAISRIENAGVGDKVKAYLGSSERVLDDIVQLYSIGNETIIFLDAHWGGYCPLFDELKAIAKNKIKPVIAIHDFLVPGEPALGFDSYMDQPFTFEWIRPALDKIYGADGYEHYYNSIDKSEGAKRGIIYITPKP